MDKKITELVTSTNLDNEDTLHKIIENPEVQEAAKEAAEEKYQNEQASEKFNAFLIYTKEQLDKHFDTLGYVVFVFDKENSKNKTVANISNCVPGYYLNKIMNYVLKHKETLRKTKKQIDKLFKRTQ